MHKSSLLIKILFLLTTIIHFSLPKSIAQNIDFSYLENGIVNLGEVNNNNEGFADYAQLKNILKDVEVVMLGEQSHGEATAYETKIKLIKYLNQEMGYDILVFESGFYDCHKAWEMIEKGENVRDAMGKSIFSVWSSTKDMIPLANYLSYARSTEHPLKLLGFDSQITGKYTQEFYLLELGEYIKKVDPKILETDDWSHLGESLTMITNYEFKNLKKRDTAKDTSYVDKLIQQINDQQVNDESSFWIRSLENIKTCISDFTLKTDNRDKTMAENLFWIKKKYPNSKIICWGATSHFLYNAEEVRMKNTAIQLLGANYYKEHPMMGDYVKKKYKQKVYTIGFTAYQGEFGLWRRRTIKPPKEETFEYLLGQSEFDNFLLPLGSLNLEGLYSRPLGNFYMKNPINNVMDAVIFNRDMKFPKLDRNFFLKMYPTNKYIKPDTTRVDRAQVL